MSHKILLSPIKLEQPVGEDSLCHFKYNKALLPFLAAAETRGDTETRESCTNANLMTGHKAEASLRVTYILR